jgi:diguanylate cyclase (GGDEF)-like protein/putative nucleotidyltransferase with HDIG domain
MVRVILAAVTAALLVAAAVLAPWMRRNGRQGALATPAVALLFLALLAGLSVALTLAPPAGPTAFPVGQTILLVAAATLLTAAISVRSSQTTQGSADLIDTGTVDALTRIASHRVFQDRLVHECERAYRFGDTFMLVLLDLDNFHAINNRHGHSVGDVILLDLARRVKSQLRDIDLVARFGGDRFAMILPHTYENGGVQVAERIRQNAAGWVFFTQEGAEIRLTLSLGLCSYPADGASAPDLVDVADKALGFAKAMGGNQVQLYRDLPAREAPDNVVSLPHSGREAIVRSLAAAVDIRDGYTRKHSHLVSELAGAVARRIGLSATEVGRISVGALLHDVGKIGIPDAILTKEGGLSPEEWDCIREHPVLGKQILEQAPELTDVTPLVLHHQERYDGTGYPEKLQGDTIPLGARIIAAADAYHAIISDRPYRPRRTHSDAVRELSRCSGAQFDPQVVDTLLCVFETDEKIRALLPDGDDLAASGATAGQPAALRRGRMLANPGV